MWVSVLSAPTTYAFIKKVIPEIKQLVPNVTVIHCLTDSPTCQYQNKHISNLTAHHQFLFDIAATWQYFETGHGKGPCDGVGGNAERNADLAVKRGLAIQSAEAFYRWGFE